MLIWLTGCEVFFSFELIFGLVVIFFLYDALVEKCGYCRFINLLFSSGNVCFVFKHFGWHELNQIN